MSDFDKQENDSKDKPLELFPTDEFVKVCEELGLLEPTINEIIQDMWTLQQQTELDDRRGSLLWV